MVRLSLSSNPTRIALYHFSVLGRASSSSAHHLRRCAAIVTMQASTSFQSYFGTGPMSNSKKVLVPIGDGSEEIETTAITDTLTRFGADVTIASVKQDGVLTCTMCHGIKVLADMKIDDAVQQEWDLVVLPGGMPGAENLRDSDSLISILQKQKDEGKLYAAICASPAVVLASKGLAEEGMTCYPAFRDELKNPVDDKDVVVTGNLTTSKGPGTSIKFALTLGEHLYGKEKADEVAQALLVER